MKRKLKKIGLSCMIIFVLAVFMAVGVSAGAVDSSDPEVVPAEEEQVDPVPETDVGGYSITMGLNGGTLPSGYTNPITGLTVYPMLPTPTISPEGHEYTAFQGWYLESTFVTPYAPLVGQEMTQNITVYAKWNTATAGNVSGLLVIFRNIVSSVFGWMTSAVDFVVDNPIILVPMLMFFVCGGVIALVKRLMRG